MSTRLHLLLGLFSSPTTSIMVKLKMQPLFFSPRRNNKPFGTVLGDGVEGG